MKKIIFLFSIALCLITGVYAEVQKPVIMVVPSKQWCATNNLGQRLDNGRFAPNMSMALENEILRDAIAGIEDEFAERDYKLADLSSSIDKIAERNSRAMILKGKDGSVPVEDDIEALIREMKADIYLELEITPLSRGAFNQVKYIIKACDAGTTKTIMSKSDVSARSSAPIERLVADAVNTFVDDMIEKIQNHFNDMRENGREIEMICMIGDGSPLTFESDVEFNGETGELAELIEYWVNENSINGSYTVGNKSANLLEFEQLRIPLTGKSKFGGKEKGVSAADFASDMRKFFAPYGLSISTSPKGIGTVYCVFGSN
ncbi:MAG: hypothetical protein K2G69_01170 [Muribaculaceae bacterium]|nr:hypothetical protein [Muribaculaceae bacterium]